MDFPLEKEEILSKNQGPTSQFHHYSLGFYTTPYSWTPKKTASIYKKKALKKSVKKEIEPKPIIKKPISLEPSFTLKSLSQIEQKSLNQFISLGAKIEVQKITLSDIKREYRRVAKTLHPDLCKEPQAQEHFQAFHDAYSILYTKITTLTLKKL